MTKKYPTDCHLHPDVQSAFRLGLPLVALESAVITHGLPYPENLNTAMEMEQLVRENGAVPATVSLVDGIVKIGTSSEELEHLATGTLMMKVSARNLAIGIVKKRSGGTTVAATLNAAHKAEIKVFATGGIGGVHRGNAFDVSADLDALAENPVIVVCAGAKSILDLPATLEALDTRGIPVLGYGTDDFPAFYTRASGLKVDARVDTPAEAAKIAQTHWNTGHRSAVIVANPIPAEYELDGDEIEAVIQKAVSAVERQKVKGAELTPFILEEVKSASGGRSLQANLALLKNNAVLAANIAVHMYQAKTVSF